MRSRPWCVVRVSETAPATTPDGRPTSISLQLDGAAGTEMVMRRLERNRSVLEIDGVRVKRGLGGIFKIPMADGTTSKLQVSAMVPGYPTIIFRGKILYRSPKPPTITLVAYMVAGLGALLLVWGWVGLILGVVAGIAARSGAAAWLGRAQNKTIPHVVLIGTGGVAGVLGIVGMVLLSTGR